MLIFPLKKQWYDKIKSGEKTVEYREFKPYWTKRIYVEFKKQFAKRYGVFSELPNYDSFTKDLEEMPVVFGDGTERSPVLWDCKLRLQKNTCPQKSQKSKLWTEKIQTCILISLCMQYIFLMCGRWGNEEKRTVGST